MFACPGCFVTKQHAGIDAHLDILILLDLVFAVQKGSVSLVLCC